MTLESVLSGGEKAWRNTRRAWTRLAGFKKTLTMTKADINLISGFLTTTSSFSQVTVSKLISVTRDKQSQSSVGVWATALMWQIWERRCVRDRRGTQRNSEARGLMPNQDWETGSSPLTRRPSAQPPLSTWNTRQPRQRQRWQLAYFHPALPVCLHQNVWVCLFPLIYIWVVGPSFLMMCAHFLLSFINPPLCLVYSYAPLLTLFFTFYLNNLTWVTVVQ